jgi:hypothetical protein
MPQATALMRKIQRPCRPRRRLLKLDLPELSRTERRSLDFGGAPAGQKCGRLAL